MRAGLWIAVALDQTVACMAIGNREEIVIAILMVVACSSLCRPSGSERMSTRHVTFGRGIIAFEAAILDAVTGGFMGLSNIRPRRPELTLFGSGCTEGYCAHHRRRVANISANQSESYQVLCRTLVRGGRGIGHRRGEARIETDDHKKTWHTSRVPRAGLAGGRYAHLNAIAARDSFKLSDYRVDSRDGEIWRACEPSLARSRGGVL